MNIISSILQRKNILKWISYLFSYHTIAFICTLLAAKFYTQWFEPEKYAIIGKFIFLITLSTTIFANWLNAAITRYIPERIARNRHPGALIKFFFQMCLLSLFILFTLSFFLKNQIFQYLGVIPPTYTILILFISSIFIVITMILQALNRFGCYSFLKSLERIFYLLIAIIITKILFFKDPLKFLDLTLLKSSTILIVTIIIIIFSKNLIVFFKLTKESLNLAEKWDILKFSIPFLFTIVIGLATNWFDFFIVSLTQSQEQTGLYFLATQINNILLLLVILPTTVLTPKLTQYLTKKDDNIIHEYTFKLVPLAHIAWITLIILVIMFTKPLIILFFSERFLDSGSYIQILFSGSAGLMMIQLLTPFINFYKETKKFMYAQLFTLLINVFLTIILIRQYQTTGICIAKAISIFSFPFIIFFLFPRLRKYLQKKLFFLVFIPIIIFLATHYLF